MNNKTKTNFGFLGSSIVESWAIDQWNGILEGAKINNINLISFIGGVLNSPREYEGYGNTIYDLVNKDLIQGLVIWSGSLNWYITKNEMLSFFKKFYPIPIVSMESEYIGFPGLLINNSQGMKDAMDHLIIDHGYRKIAFIRGPEGHTGAQERYRAYMESLEKHDIRYDENLVSKPDNYWDGETQMKELLDVRKMKIDAVVGVNDSVCGGAMKYMKNHGIKIPHDIAIVGFDDDPRFRVSTPPLTSVKMPFHKMGKRAFEILFELIEHRSVPEKELFPPNLIIRQSCGCKLQALIKSEIKKTSMLYCLFSKWKNRLNQQKLLKKIENMVLIDKTKNDDNCLEKLWQSFFSDINKSQKSRSFIILLENILNQSIIINSDLSVWQDIISSLRGIALPHIMKRSSLIRAENIFHQSRILINELSLRNLGHIHVENNHQQTMIQSVCQSLITSFNIKEIMDIAANEFPKLGIKQCYIFLYNNLKSIHEESQIILAYDEKGVKKINLEENIFLSSQLNLKNLLSRDEEINSIVLPLYFQNENIGFIVFDICLINPSNYEVLRVQLSSALKGAKLIRQIKDHEKVLATGIDELKSFLDIMSKNLDDINNNMIKQSNAVVETVSSIEEVARNIDSTSVMSNKSNELSNNLNNTAVNGEKATQESIASIKEVFNHSNQILSILELIQNIAKNINILGINAAIESAHAGDYGKGFSVVAETIRTLTENTEKNIKEINDVIEIIVLKIKESVNLSEKAGNGLNMIVSYSNQNVEIISQLNQAMVDQNSSSKEILTANQELLEITEDVRMAINLQKEAMNEINASIKKLSEFCSGNK